MYQQRQVRLAAVRRSSNHSCGVKNSALKVKTLRTSTPLTRRELGRYGEEAAANYLEKVGLTILDRNWRDSGRGEVDIVAREGATVIFVEVKTRSGLGAGLASEAVGDAKLHRLKLLALAWLWAHEDFSDYRIDVVGVYVRRGREPIFEWLQDVAQ